MYDFDVSSIEKEVASEESNLKSKAASAAESQEEANLKSKAAAWESKLVDDMWGWDVSSIEKEVASEESKLKASAS